MMELETGTYLFFLPGRNQSHHLLAVRRRCRPPHRRVAPRGRGAFQKHGVQVLKHGEHVSEQSTVESQDVFVE